MSSHPPRRLVLLCVLAAALGLASGATAWVLIKFIAILTNLALFHRWGTTLPSFADLPIGPAVVVAAVAGAVDRDAAGPVVADHPRPRHPRGHGGGADEAQQGGAPHGRRQAAVGRGGHRHRRPVRRRGPDHRDRRRPRLAHRPGAAHLGQRAQDPAGLRRGGGMAATFGTPLAAVVLAIELLLFEFSARAFIPLAVGDERGRRRARPALRQRPAVHRARPQVHRPRPAAAVRRARAGVRASSPSLISRGLFAVEGRVPPAARSASAWHPVVGGRGCGRRSGCSCRVRSASATT